MRCSPGHIVLVLLALLGVAGAPRTARAGADVDLVVFHGPASPSPLAADARALAQARARDAGHAWLDLSPAPPPPPQAPARLREAIDAYAELRWDDALAALDAVVTEVDRSGGAGLVTTELSDAFLYRGLVHTQRGDTTDAWDDLVRAATVAPARTLDPLRFPTRAVEAFDRARAAVAKLPRARLTVDAPGCTIAIDGGAAASTEVVHGDHVVLVECPGRAPWGQRVTVAGDVAIAPGDDVAASPPGDDQLAALASERGALAVLAVIVGEGDGAAPTVTLRVIDAGGVVSRRGSLALDDAAVVPGGALDAAIDDVLARPVPLATAPPPPRRRWWKSPWLWAAVGAAVTAAVLVPFAVRDDGGTDSASLRPLGWTW